MKTVEEKLASLKENDVWVFTKQTADFDEAFKMVRLFSEIPNIETTNIESYFATHHTRYDIATDRHRALIMPQMYGLLTKTSFFSKGAQYGNESPTGVFEELNRFEIGSPAYNTIKTEQLLKVRMKPIIDSTDGCYDQVILPVIFSFMVLWRLKKQGINSISKDQFYTYVMTCKNFSELRTAVTLLRKNPPSSALVKRYKDKSRIQTLFERNCKLFTFQSKRISINDTFGEYFYNSFILPTDLSKINRLLDQPEDYANFLYNIQGFGINLIDPPGTSSNPYEAPANEEKFDADYVDSVDGLKEDYIDLHAGDDTYKNPPQTASTSEGKRIKKNPLLGKIAIINSGYKCIANKEHTTFKSKKTHNNFMEAHHLIPIRYAIPMWERFKANIDCVENLVSLCPNCHRAVHYGSEMVRLRILQKLFILKRKDLERIGIRITFEDLIWMYTEKMLEE